MAFSLEEYSKYRNARRVVTISKVNTKIFLNLQTFDSWTGILQSPEIEELDPLLLQQNIDSLQEQITSLINLQNDIKNTPSQ